MALQLLRAMSVAPRPQLVELGGLVTRNLSHHKRTASAAATQGLEALSTNKVTMQNAAVSNDARNKSPDDHAKRNIIFEDPRGEKVEVRAADGQTVLDIAKSKELEIEGACAGECACSTCHCVIASEADYEMIPPTTEKEEDMLDLAFGVTNTSRLACQVRMTPELDGTVIKLPGIVRDARTA